MFFDFFFFFGILFYFLVSFVLIVFFCLVYYSGSTGIPFRDALSLLISYFLDIFVSIEVSSPSDPLVGQISQISQDSVSTEVQGGSTPARDQRNG